MGLKMAFGGLLAGIGKGMATDADNRQKAEQAEREGDALYRRQVALKQVSTQIDEESKLRTDAAATRNNIIEKQAELGLRSEADAENDARTAAREAANDDREFQIWRKKHGIEQGSAREMEAYKSKLEIERDAIKAGTQIDRWEITEDGQLVGITKSGRMLRDTTGTKFVPRNQSSGEDDIFGDEPTPAPSRRGLPAVGGGKPAPAPAPKPAAGGRTISQNALANLYNEASAAAANGDARFRGLNAAQIKAKVDAKLKAQGITVAP